jgi:hypothetical protein
VQTYFCRHTEDLDIDAISRKKLWEQRFIAIHFPLDCLGALGEQDNISLNYNDYLSHKAKGEIRALVELSQQGGYVCAQYHGEPDCLMGVVEPNTPIQLLECSWGHKSKKEGRTVILKTLPLSRVKIINPNNHAMVLNGRPRQGTFMRWPRSRDTIKNIVEDKTSLLNIDSLSPDQQEIMCSEFLRSPQTVTEGLPRLTHLLTPIGRTMKDIDIIALAEDGKRILVQVTHTKRAQATNKLQRLARYASKTGDYLILFCDTDKKEQSSGVTVYPIRNVFDRFTSTEVGTKWLQSAIHSWQNEND